MDDEYKHKSDQYVLLVLEIEILKQNTKTSLDATWKNFLSHDWMPPDVAHRFSVEKFYVNLKWTKIDRGVFRDFREDIRRILDILKTARDGCRILVEGEFNN